MKNVLITGSRNGLGRLIADRLRLESGFNVMNYDIADGDDVRAPFAGWHALPSELDILINNAAVNRINWLPDVTVSELDEVIDVNIKGLFLMSQACAPLLRRSRGTILNIVSNAAHLPMRCSAAYNASKGAALMLTRQLARELAPEVTVFSVSPNKLRGTVGSRYIEKRVVETRGWTPEEAKEYQLQSLLPHEETDPDVVAEFISFLLSRKDRHKYLAGCDLPYGV